jgi:hypothetical protein
MAFIQKVVHNLVMYFTKNKHISAGTIQQQDVFQTVLKESA